MTKVKRLPKKIKVTVTKEDIRRGIREDPESCPIARAVRRATGRRFVAVDEAITFDSTREVYNLTPQADQFINDFDRGDNVKPFKFTSERCGVLDEDI